MVSLGISFFIFQSIAYVVDVYRKDTPAVANYLDYLAYIAFFPTIIAGNVTTPQGMLCLPASCVQGGCPAGQTCVNMQCVPSCTGVVCPSGQTCEDGSEVVRISGFEFIKKFPHGTAPGGSWSGCGRRSGRSCTS